MFSFVFIATWARSSREITWFSGFARWLAAARSTKLGSCPRLHHQVWKTSPSLLRNSPATDPLLSRGLQRMVASLTDDARAVIILRYQEELELADIAEILDIPVNTVKSRLQRSLEMLREKFHRWAGDVQR